MNDVDRFNSFVVKSDTCWSWSGGIGKNGYPQFWHNGKTISAHSFRWFLMTGSFVEPGKVVRHTCHNKVCTNPEHLVSGTPKDNTQDMVAAGRSAKGERNGQSKLTTEVAALIRDSEESLNVLARRFGVSKSSIHKIKKGRSWAEAKH